ncbi:hypothetical protein [Pseudomonas monteilii]|uniref:hypothetical protein n=1 Tax=Pseudomonas monteilii TaxID=76759 RepID=UPI001378F2BE|nr:hypothetical protein [Pseudomonas monteilii]NBB07917.1 hypothetical protein [Pseudomonas monteilii]
MLNELLLSYQRTLVVSSLDEVSGISILSDWHGGQYGGQQAKWRKAVSRFVFRSYAAGLIDFIDPDIYEIKNIEQLSEKYEILEVDENRESLVLWNAVLYSSTKKLDGLVKKHGLNSWGYLDFGLNGCFMNEIFSIYRTVDPDVSDISGS